MQNKSAEQSLPIFQSAPGPPPPFLLQTSFLFLQLSPPSSLLFLPTTPPPPPILISNHPSSPPPPPLTLPAERVHPSGLHAGGGASQSQGPGTAAGPRDKDVVVGGNHGGLVARWPKHTRQLHQAQEGWLH